MTATAYFRLDDRNTESTPRQRILVVGDETDLRQRSVEVLLEAGYQVDVADDGATAWTALPISHYDLLITDQFLSKLSGVELLKKIHVARMPMPAIMITKILPTWEFTLHPCLQSVMMLQNPYPMGKLLGLVKSVLARTAPVGVGGASSKWERELETVDFPEIAVF